MKIAFFDFDGTITKKDSTIGFIRFFVGDLKFIFGIIIVDKKIKSCEDINLDLQ